MQVIYTYEEVVDVFRKCSRPQKENACGNTFFVCLWVCGFAFCSCFCATRRAYLIPLRVLCGWLLALFDLRSRATLNVSQTFGHGQSQKKLHYSYDVTHPATAKVIKLAELGEDLAAVVCSPDGLSLAFTSAEAADTFHAELLDISRSTTATEADRIVVTGGPEWKCAKRQADHQQSGSPQQHVNPCVLRFARRCRTLVVSRHRNYLAASNAQRCIYFFSNCCARFTT